MNKQQIADLSLLFVAFIWGTTFAIVKDAIAIVPPFTFLALRFLFAAIFLALLFPKKLFQLNTFTLASGTIVGLIFFVGYAFQTIGLQYTTASKAGFITGLSVVIVPILATILMKKPPTSGAIVGVACAAVGLALLSLNQHFTLEKGDTIILGCAFAFAIHILTVSKFTPHVDPILFSLMQIITVSVVSSLFAWRTESIIVNFNHKVIWALLITAPLATSLALVIQSAMQKCTTATRTALIFSMEPVFSALFSYFYLHEHLTIRTVTGCMLVFLGMILAEITPGKKRKLKIDN